MTIPPSYLDIGMVGHFEGFGGCKGLVKQCVEVIKTDYLSPAETILQRLASVRCFQIPET
jgi:hypothetical protein